MESTKTKIWHLYLRLEQHLCSEACGVVDRRRVLAFVLLTLVETVIIPFHFVLLYMKEAWVGFYYNILHTIVFLLLQYLIFSRKLVFKKGISLLYVLAFLKLVADNFLCLYHQHDSLSVIGNIYVMFVLAITALSQRLSRAALVISTGLLVVVAIAFSHTPVSVVLFSFKAVLVGFLMILYVWLYNQDLVTSKGLRQPHQVMEEERKALEMLANLTEDEKKMAQSLFVRLSQKQQQNIIDLAAEQLKQQEFDELAWDEVCPELTKSEKLICRLVLDGKTLKEICTELNKSESNITSQRCHIRKKLNMGRKDDLKRVLELRIAQVRDR